VRDDPGARRLVAAVSADRGRLIPGEDSMHETTPLPLRTLVAPGLVVAAAVWLLITAVAFDQGALLAPITDAMRDSGGMFHEFFHDARHLLGVPCH
jgi:Probable cobalt transporter subunit (CbtB)